MKNWWITKHGTLSTRKVFSMLLNICRIKSCQYFKDCRIIRLDNTERAEQWIQRVGWSGGWRGLNELLWKFIDIYPGSSAGLVAGGWWQWPGPAQISARRNHAAEWTVDTSTPSHAPLFLCPGPVSPMHFCSLNLVSSFFLDNIKLFRYRTWGQWCFLLEKR